MSGKGPNFKIKTPHAAVLVWNYNDRIGTPTGGFNSSGVSDLDGIEKEQPAVIVSTLSCISISTNKAKGQPDGSFNLVLAPYKNWTSTLTAGSWCCIMMSNEAINEKDLKQANPKLVKMFGRIETVRCETQVDDTGARRTLYYVSGVDWGHIFNSMLYIDNLIAAPNDPQSQGNTAAVAIRNALFGKYGSPQSFLVRQNLANILDVMGKSLNGVSTEGDTIGRLAKAIYDFTLPEAVSEFFRFKGPNSSAKAKQVSKLINLVTGSLTAYDQYEDKGEASGFIDPFSLQGTHTLWQVLMENSNPVLNEMFCDLNWGSDGRPKMVLYNRIRPFSYKDFKPAAGKKAGFESYYTNVKTHVIDTVDVMSVNAGTNWRDKYNFIEIKPQFQEFAVVANWYKQKSQVFDPEAFNREGFRPLIFDTKQFPSGRGSSGLPENVGIDWDQLEVWCSLLREWYFGTHRLLNGTITLHGTTEYIGVGNNIRFHADLLNPNPNVNYASKKAGQNQYILGHVESISHAFTINPDNGARTYKTTINFVRGIIVSESNVRVGMGLLDQFASSLSQPDDRNQLNTISTSEDADPDPQKIRGN